MSLNNFVAALKHLWTCDANFKCFSLVLKQILYVIIYFLF